MSFRVLNFFGSAVESRQLPLVNKLRFFITQVGAPGSLGAGTIFLKLK